MLSFLKRTVLVQKLQLTLDPARLSSVRQSQNESCTEILSSFTVRKDVDEQRTSARSHDTLRRHDLFLR